MTATKDSHKIRTISQPGGKKDHLLLGNQVGAPPPRQLLSLIQKVLKKTYQNNDGNVVIDHQATIERLQPLLDEFRFYETKNLGTRQLEMVSEAYNDLGVSLAEKAKREKVPPLQFQARTYYLEAIRLYPNPLAARNFSRLLEAMGEWKELKEITDWALKKFPTTDWRNELKRMHSKARRRSR